MILADTSAWMEYDRATGSAVDIRLTDLIEGDGQLAVTEPVVMEVLAGARDELREQQLRRLLRSFQLARLDAASDWEAAARIYRRCRRVGVTPRGLTDCLIAAVAWRRRAALLSYDVDLARVATVMDIGLDSASLRAQRRG